MEKEGNQAVGFFEVSTAAVEAPVLNCISSSSFRSNPEGNISFSSGMDSCQA